MSDVVLVTGGAGYIGSHTATKLVEQGKQVIVLDNLSTGFKSAVPTQATFVEGDVGDGELIKRVIDQYQVKNIIHFAARLIVPESVAEPIRYYQNNVIATQNLIFNALELGVENFIFSSTCAVYGMVETYPVDEQQTVQPISPYGRSKCVSEWYLQDIATAIDLGHYQADFKHVILRYFNVAGAKVDGTLGQLTKDTTHLVKVCAEAVLGKRSQVNVFGTDYATADGTCIRDYIHVDDLAQAHLDAMQYLQKGGRSDVFNCGYGHGYSVKEIIDVMKKVSGVDFKVVEDQRREGDPPAIAANCGKIKQALAWSPQHDDIELICRTALDWEAKN